MTNSEHIPAEELSAFIDGDVDEPRAQKIQVHLDQCQACAGIAEELRALRGSLSEMADVEPHRDLWPSASHPEVSWWRRFWMVPAAAVVGAAAALLIVFVVGRPVDKPAGPGPLSAMETVAKAEVEYRNAIAALETAVKTSQPRWNPETKAVVEQGLAQMNQTIDRCRTALKKNQSDPQAQEALLTAYQYKVDFLTDLVAESL
jgi:anti-sigma factor RsiW